MKTILTTILCLLVTVAIAGEKHKVCIALNEAMSQNDKETTRDGFYSLLQESGTMHDTRKILWDDLAGNRWELVSNTNITFRILVVDLRMEWWKELDMTLAKALAWRDKAGRFETPAHLQLGACDDDWAAYLVGEGLRQITNGVPEP